MRFDSAKKFIFPKWKEGGINLKLLDYFKFSDPQKQIEFQTDLVKDYITENTNIEFGVPQFFSFHEGDSNMTFDISYNSFLKESYPKQVHHPHYEDVTLRYKIVDGFEISVDFEIDVMESSVKGPNGSKSLSDFRNIGKFNQTWSDSVIRGKLKDSLENQLKPLNIIFVIVYVYYMSNGVSESVVMDMDRIKRLLK
jgi:hypothetical protein